MSGIKALLKMTKKLNDEIARSAVVVWESNNASSTAIAVPLLLREKARI